MISKDGVREIVLSGIAGTSIFPVDVKVDTSGKILVEVDKPEGITIEECASISRTIREALGESEDFDLEVSSPGVTSGFKVIDQYRKNCGRAVEVVTKDGQKYDGILQSVSEEGIILMITIRTKTAGQKRLHAEQQVMPLIFKDIKSTKVTINFS
ncbi:MAG: ribosome assembly cofactor RimP [Bacteroidales bacterium]|nr:ribosome assembly cofactor RimP [Bacteroidales bacterium]